MFHIIRSPRVQQQFRAGMECRKLVWHPSQIPTQPLLKHPKERRIGWGCFRFWLLLGLSPDKRKFSQFILQVWISQSKGADLPPTLQMRITWHVTLHITWRVPLPSSAQALAHWARTHGHPAAVMPALVHWVGNGEHGAGLHAWPPPPCMTSVGRRWWGRATGFGGSTHPSLKNLGGGLKTPHHLACRKTFASSHNYFQGIVPLYSLLKPVLQMKNNQRLIIIENVWLAWKTLQKPWEALLRGFTVAC